MSTRSLWPVALVCLILVFLLSPHVVLSGGKSWKGNYIVPKKPGIVLTDTGPDGEDVVVGTITDFVLKVVNDKDGWLLVRQKKMEGWISKTDAVLLQDALPHLESRLKENSKDEWALKCRKYVAAWIELGPPPSAGSDVPSTPLIKP